MFDSYAHGGLIDDEFTQSSILGGTLQTNPCTIGAVNGDDDDDVNGNDGFVDDEVFRGGDCFVDDGIVRGGDCFVDDVIVRGSDCSVDDEIF